MSEQTSKAWLQRLKDESWEAELLVAAISIFGTLQLFTFVEWITDVFINLLPESFYLIAYFVVFSALLAISILASMFIIHLMLRAYWVGLVGLNSVFSDYSVDDSEDTKLYMKFLVEKLPKLDDSINKADRLCSVIFSAAFGFLMAYGWMFVSSAFYLLVANALYGLVPNILLLLPFFILIALMLAQMIVLYICRMKRYQTNDYWHRIYVKISIFISVFSYGPLYKAILQISSIFSSNFKHDKALVKLVLLFVLCGFGLAASKIISTNIVYLIFPSEHFNPYSAEPRLYRDQAENESFLLAPQLNSNVIKRDIFEVFVPVFSSERAIYREECEAYSNLEDPTRTQKREADLICLQQLHTILVNGEPVEHHIIKTQHATTGQNGIMIYVEIDDALDSGFYKVEIQKHIYKEHRSWKIPFYYSSNKKARNDSGV